MDVQFGPVKIDAHGAQALDERAEAPVQFDGRERIRLERSAGADPERLEPAPLDHALDGRLHRVDLRGHLVPERAVRDTEDARDPGGHLIGVRLVGQGQDDTAGELPDAARPQVDRGRLEIAQELPQEQGPRAAFEADLVVVHDDARTQSHRKVTPDDAERPRRRKPRRSCAPAPAPPACSRS